MPEPEFSFFGAQALLLDWQRKIAPEIHQTILNYERAILSSFGEHILETVVTYHSLAIYLKSGVDSKQFMAELKSTSFNPAILNTSKKICWKIPVCYELGFDWDLNTVSERLNLSANEVIALHTTPKYRIYFTGFLPGFMYLGGLDQRLQIPRKKTPRISIPAGAVGIGGVQTGIYPANSPGGWQIIGKTPIRLFDPNEMPPSPFNPGDFIRFYVIDTNEYQRLSNARQHGEFQLEKTVMDD